MEQFVYLQPNSLPKELCKEIMDMFEQETEAQYLGVTGSGYIKGVKDTLDLTFPEINKGCKYYNLEKINRWNIIKDVLYRELSKNLKKYNENLKKQFDMCFFEEDNQTAITDNGFLMHKYFQGKGKFTRHHDFHSERLRHRVIVYLWYLNNVEEGGETQVFEHIKIKPEAGKLLMFPAQWCFPHCGIMPLSGDKFIITGWLHLPN